MDLENLPLLSAIVPCHDEEDTVAALHRRLTATLTVPDFPCRAEIVYVDDGSRDRTLVSLRALRNHPVPVRIVPLSRNFGHDAAILAGLSEANGDAVCILDADLQHPPETIPHMVHEWLHNGIDVVHAVRRTQLGEAPLKRCTGKLFYRLLTIAADGPAPPLDAGNFKLISRPALQAFLSLPERKPFFRALLPTVGFSQVCIPYDQPVRTAGHTKYTFRSRLALAADTLFTLSPMPMRLATLVSAAACLLSTALALVCLFSGQGLIPTGIFLIFAAQALASALRGRTLESIRQDVKHRPAYVKLPSSRGKTR